MNNARTIKWENVAGWVAENEQQIRDVMKFEGLKGAMVEVLRLAPDQPELASLREDNNSLSERFESVCSVRDALREELEHQQCQVRSWKSGHEVLKQRLTAAEQRNVSLLETARGLTIQLHATIGNAELHEDCIRDLSALETGNAED